MKIYTSAVLAALVAIPAAGAESENLLIDNPTIEKTFENWKDKDVIYDFSVDLGGAKDNSALKDTPDLVKINSVEGWFETWGDMSRYAWQGGSDETFLNCPGVDGGKVSDWPFPLLSMYESWSNWWSMAVCQQKTEVDLSHINADTHLHMAVRILSDVVTGPMNISFFTSENNDTQNDIAVCPKFSLIPEGFDASSSNYNVDYPVIGTLKKGDWVGIDITLGELERINKETDSSFAIDYSRLKNFTGRIWTIAIPSKPSEQKLKDAVFALDGIYFYTPVDRIGLGVDEIEDGKSPVQIVTGAGYVSAIGSEGIEIYDMAGRIVAKSVGSMVGTEGLKGVYVVRAAGAVRKIIL